MLRGEGNVGASGSGAPRGPPGDTGFPAGGAGRKAHTTEAVWPGGQLCRGHLPGATLASSWT